MKVLMDTSSLIAAMLPDHSAHQDAVVWLSQAKAGSFDLIVSGHTLAEIYSVLTRLPRTPRISAADGARLIRENVAVCATVVTLSGQDYLTLVEDLAGSNIVGGAVYDAVIAQAADAVGVDVLLTLNVADFQRVWPAKKDRVISPTAAAPP